MKNSIINRRNAIRLLGTAGMMGAALPVLAHGTPKKKDSPGFIVINQCVGAMPPHQAEAMCNRVKDHFCSSKEWVEFHEKYPNWNFILQPVRDSDSYVEIYHDDEGQRKEVQSVVVECLEQEPQMIEDTAELRKRAKEYVLLMLGAPVAKIELTDGQLDFCYDSALNKLQHAYARRKYFTLLDSARAQDENFLIDGVLAHAMIVLGRIRTHSGCDPEARNLLLEGEENLNIWQSRLTPETIEEQEIV